MSFHIESRRRADFVTPIPRPRRRQGGGEQQEMQFADAAGISTGEQQYDPTSIINELRGRVDQWRKLPDPGQWGVTPETARPLQHWRHHPFQEIRPFFCQVEAVETLIWLTEVAPRLGNRARVFLDHIEGANEQANPGLPRTALKLATGAGKTTILAWKCLTVTARRCAATSPTTSCWWM
ncbi:MAG: hypothetical protein L0H83_08755, partial [Salinisphaera sp.]|nr:hypothetical protein [Salinisphaera sp.]